MKTFIDRLRDCSVDVLTKMAKRQKQDIAIRQRDLDTIEGVLKEKQAPADAEREVIEMGLCEVEHTMMRPNRLYRFVVLPNCEKCQKLADVYKNT